MVIVIYLIFGICYLEFLIIYGIETAEILVFSTLIEEHLLNPSHPDFQQRQIILKGFIDQ
jgi:hypothetical protein